MSDLRFSRLQRAFSRAGIAVDYRDGVYHLHHEVSQATVLLPPSLPLEEKAVNQLLAFASVRSPDGKQGVCKACATPDFHPGSVAPVGSVVATDADFVIPAAVGTDINCGMRLLTTGLTLDQVAPHKTRLIARLTRSLLDNGRDVPVHTAAFRALFDLWGLRLSWKQSMARGSGPRAIGTGCNRRSVPASALRVSAAARGMRQRLIPVRGTRCSVTPASAHRAEATISWSCRSLTK